MTMATLSIDRRFCGPPGSGNGGYTAGRLAALTGDPAEIMLRRPPSLETEMRVERAGPGDLAVAADPDGRVTGGRWGRTVRVVGGVRSGMGSVVAMTFAIDHLDFFRLRQVRRYITDFPVMAMTVTRCDGRILPACAIRRYVWNNPFGPPEARRTAFSVALASCLANARRSSPARDCGDWPARMRAVCGTARLPGRSGPGSKDDNTLSTALSSGPGNSVCPGQRPTQG